MPSLGYGLGFRNSLCSGGSGQPPENGLPVVISPGEAWTGTAGSGYATIPVDKVRTTAKPAVRLLVPPRQRFTDELLVGVVAYANDAGTLIGGIDRVRFYFEGNTADILAPTFQTFNRQDGSTYRQIGYWVKLKRASVNGTAHLYIEAIPADATMQTRVLGPLSFALQPTLHDATITIDPDLPAVTGSRYPNINTAANYCRTQGFANPLLRVVKAGNYTLASWNGYNPANYCTVEATVPGVSFGQAAGWTYRPVDNFGVFSNGVWWKSVVFNFANATHYRSSGAGGAVFDKCTLIDPNGRGRLYAGNPNSPVNYLVYVDSWLLDSHLEGVHNPLSLVALARGCTTLNTSADWAINPKCIVNCIGVDHDPRDARVDVNSLTVQYTGVEATATIAISGTRGADGRTLTLKWGANTATLLLESDLTSFNIASAGGFNPVTAGFAYWPSQVVTWINAQTGWTATLLDSTRIAGGLGISGAATAAFPDTSAKAAPLTLSTWFDAHADLYQPTIATENVIFADSLLTKSASQNLFLSTSNAALHFRDAFFVNLVITNKIEVDGNYAWNVAASGCGGAHSHVVVAHVTMPDQAFNMLTANPGTAWTPDAYSLCANNAFYRMNAGNGAQSALAPAIRDNAIWGDQIDHPKATGTIIDGDRLTWYPDLENANFAPAGEILSNPKQARLRFDMRGIKRKDLAPVGAQT